MYVDPDGKLGIFIPFLVGALLGFGIPYAKEVVNNMKDGFDWSDFKTSKKNLQKYFISALKGAVIGLSFGTGANFGILAFTSGVRISTGLALSSFAFTTIGSAIAGGGIYLLETKIFNLKEYNTKEFFKSSLNLGIKGALNFGMGLLLGNQGYFLKGKFIERNYLKQILLKPFEIIIDGFFNS